MILVREILRKFDIDSVYICPPYLYTVATLPWEIQKSHFQQLFHIYFRLFVYCYLIRKQTITVVLQSVYLLLFMCFLLSV